MSVLSDIPLLERARVAITLVRKKELDGVMALSIVVWPDGLPELGDDLAERLQFLGRDIGQCVASVRSGPRAGERCPRKPLPFRDHCWSHRELG